jgi:hypothetical protein
MLTTDDPGHLLHAATERVLALAQTWLAWDGRPRVTADGERVYTPHKALRRHADHLVDHLAQTQALLVGETPQDDAWQASLVTLDSDWARFTDADLREAQQRLRRLTTAYRQVLTTAGPPAWDTPRGDGVWTLREIAVHVADPWYAEQVGDLTALG